MNTNTSLQQRISVCTTEDTPFKTYTSMNKLQQKNTTTKEDLFSKTTTLYPLKNTENNSCMPKTNLFNMAYLPPSHFLNLLGFHHDHFSCYHIFILLLILHILGHKRIYIE